MATDEKKATAPKVKTISKKVKKDFRHGSKDFKAGETYNFSKAAAEKYASFL